MGSLNSGIGDRVGRSPDPTPEEVQASAWALINKSALGIMRDSIEQVFSQLTPRYTTGYLGGFGYKTAAKEPLLEHPLENVRVSKNLTPLPDNSWQQTYQDLVKQLPPDLQRKFIEEGKKPFNMRLAAFVVLDNVLTTTAKFLFNARSLSEPFSDESLEMERTIYNQLLPIAALKNGIPFSNTINQEAQQFLEQQGPNHLDFYPMVAALNDMQNATRQLALVNENLKTSNDGELSTQAKKQADKAADILKRSLQHLEQTRQSNDFYLLQASIKSLSILASALSLPRTQTASLFVGLSIASIGLHTDDSQSGIIGPHLSKLLDSINSGIGSALLPEGNDASRELLSLLNTTSLLVLTGLTSQASIGPLPNRSSSQTFSFVDPITLGALSTLLMPAAAPLVWIGAIIAMTTTLLSSMPTEQSDVESTEFFAMATTLRLLMSSECLNTYFQECLAAVGASEKAQREGASLMELIAHLFIIFSTPKHNPADLLAESEKYVGKISETAADVTAEQVKKVQGEETIAIQARQWHLAIDEHNSDEAVNILSEALERLETPMPELLKEIEKIKKTATLIAAMLINQSDENPSTGIISVV